MIRNVNLLCWSLFDGLTINNHFNFVLMFNKPFDIFLVKRKKNKKNQELDQSHVSSQATNRRKHNNLRGR